MALGARLGTAVVMLATTRAFLSHGDAIGTPSPVSVVAPRVLGLAAAAGRARFGWRTRSIVNQGRYYVYIAFIACWHNEGRVGGSGERKAGEREGKDIVLRVRAHIKLLHHGRASLLPRPR